MENSRMMFKDPDPSGYGFRYTTNNKMDFVNQSLKEVRHKYQKVDELINYFRSKNAKRLGLLATFIYIYKKYKIEDDEKLIELVMKVKPMFNKWEVENTLKDYKSFIKSDKLDLMSLQF